MTSLKSSHGASDTWTRSTLHTCCLNSVSVRARDPQTLFILRPAEGGHETRQKYKSHNVTGPSRVTSAEAVPYERNRYLCTASPSILAYLSVCTPYGVCTPAHGSHHEGSIILRQFSDLFRTSRLVYFREHERVPLVRRDSLKLLSETADFVD